MKPYTVIIKSHADYETYINVVHIDAESAYKAMELAERKFKDENFIDVEDGDEVEACCAFVGHISPVA